MPLYNYLTDALFFGFGFITVLVLLPYYFFSPELKSIVSFLIESSCKLVRVVALIYFIVAIAFLIEQAWDDSHFFRKENFLGSGSAFFWIKIVTVPLSLQLFWFPKTYKNNWIVFILALVTAFSFLILNERFIIVITSLHRDFIPDGWNNNTHIMILYYLRYLGEQLLIFTGFLVPYHVFRLYKLK